MRGALGFFGAALTGAILAHLAISAGASAWIADRYSHRLFNVRNIDDPKEWGPLTRLFVEGQGLDDPRPKILTFGSSLTWGYSWSEHQVFTWHLQRMLQRYQVLNVAVIGQDLLGLIRLECYLQELPTNVIAATIEVNLFNMKFNGSTTGGELSCEKNATYLPLGGAFNYLHYTLLHPWGFEYFRAFWDEYEYSQPERSFSWAPLPEAYFPSLEAFLANRAHMNALVRTSIERARAMTTNVVIFVAPTLREGVNLAEYASADLEQMADMVMEICGETDQAVCLNPGLDLPREDFGNLTHLNIWGHREFASWLLSWLPIPSATPVDRSP